MKKQIILNVNDNGYYQAKLLICALYNRKITDKTKMDTIEVIMNCSKILEKRLDIPSLKYTNEQIKNGSKVFISFPFEQPVYISGENVFNITKQRDFKNIMIEVCDYLDISIDFGLKTLVKQYLLAIQYINELVVKFVDNTVTLQNIDFFSDNDLINFITLTTTPTLSLAEIIKKDFYDVDDERLEIIQQTEQLPEHKNLVDIGRELILFPDIKLPADLELNSDLFMSSSKMSNIDTVLTTTHLINLLTYSVVTGECPSFYLPERDSSRFLI